MQVTQQEVDARNAEFWDELCGTAFAKQLGVEDASPESLRRFDAGYFGFYPYLERYVPTAEELRGRKVLEIGLGFGTMSQLLAERGAEVHGLDIAAGPVAMVSDRLERLGLDPAGRVVQGSALDIPFPSDTFDYVFTIGCLHHTGDVPRSVAEVHRVLAPGGTAVVMLYNKHSYRQLVQLPTWRLKTAIRSGLRSRSLRELGRAAYDRNLAGEAAPHTDFTSRREVRRLFREFRRVDIEARNFDPLVLLRGRISLDRERLLDSPLERVLGLDLYITAVK
jgi:ubiquinone/menaquinone biosynthesis C-methylase UbiE